MKTGSRTAAAEQKQTIDAGRKEIQNTTAADAIDVADQSQGVQNSARADDKLSESEVSTETVQERCEAP
jgi:hypothetical protein